MGIKLYSNSSELQLVVCQWSAVVVTDHMHGDPYMVLHTSNDSTTVDTIGSDMCLQLKLIRQPVA